jgi:hypothetical protein
MFSKRTEGTRGRARELQEARETQRAFLMKFRAERFRSTMRRRIAFNVTSPNRASVK